MSTTATALMGFIAWYMVLYFMIAGLRTSLVLSNKKAANSFKADGSDVSAFSERLCRAHANCYESFPFVGGLLIFALITNSTAVTDPLALVLLTARILQSVIHILSTSILAVNLRFAFFMMQLVVASYWLVQFAQPLIS